MIHIECLVNSTEVIARRFVTKKEEKKVEEEEEEEENSVSQSSEIELSCQLRYQRRQGKQSDLE